MKRLLQVTVCFALLTGASAWADTHTMSACSSAAFTTAYNAASAGDTVLFPAGSCTLSGWSTVIDKAVTIQGRTTGCPSACSDVTTISGSTIYIRSNNAVVTGLTFTGASADDGHVIIHRTSSDDIDYSNWRVSVNHFTNWTGYGIKVGSYGPPGENQRKFFPGLIDNNRFDTSDGQKFLEAYGGTGNHSTWANTVTLGGPDFLFVEDNIYNSTCIADGRASLDTDSGMRIVVRGNTFTNGWITGHGSEYGGDPRNHPGTHAFEVYHNTFNGNGYQCGTSSPYWIRSNYRGGAGVMHNNTFSGVGNIPAIFQYYRGNVSGYCNVAYACNGSFAADGNTAGTNGWVCYTQPGSTGASGITSVPIYTWKNTWDGTGCNATTKVCFDQGYNDCGYNHVATGRDLILMTPSNEGTTLPATCTVGAGYWKTNEGYWNSKTPGVASGALYKCTATNVWTVSYVPYPYPHPLRSGLSAPTGLK